MEEIKALLELANRKLQTADHLTYVTYNLVKENKLLIGIMENIYDSLVAGMDAILRYDRMYKRIPIYSKDIHTRIELFRLKSGPRYKFDVSQINLIEELRCVLAEHKNSPFELSRDDKFIMFNVSFKANALSIETIKKYINQAKIFMSKVNKVFIDVRRQ
ncbi:MAG: hypothetical protein AABW49_00590 [Nanoarchaeota archaeon]